MLTVAKIQRVSLRYHAGRIILVFVEVIKKEQTKHTFICNH